MKQTSGAEHKRLDVLIGRWKTDGSTRDMPGAPAVKIDAVDTYEWLPGGFALLHSVDAKMGDDKVEGAEIIGYDPDRGTYVTQYFGNDEATAYEAELTQERDGLKWRMRSKTTRFTGVFDEDGKVITGHWELLQDGRDWQPWMDITLTKQGN